MVFEKHLVLFILILHFLCALCNDDAPQEETIIISHRKSSYNSGAMESLADIDDTFAKTLPSSTTNDSETTESLTSTSYETTTDTVESTFPSTTENVIQTTQSKTTVTPDDVTSTESTTIDPTICDPLWPVNASVDTREVINLKIHEVNTENIIVSWEPPCNNAINVSIIYLIERCENENCSQINETDIWYNATDLDPCTQYTFNIKVLTEFWESDGLLITATTDYNISEIGDVLDLSVRNISVNVVQLIWHAPAIHAKCISNYSITQCDERFCNETIVSVTNYTANNLEPCTKYHFTVKTITQAVQSAGVNETAKTASLKLSAPQFLRVLPGNFSLTVTWEPPESGTTCLKHYHISIDPNKSIFNTTKTNITIYQLHACTKYQVYVNAVNEDNIEGDAAIKSNTTCRFRTNPPVYKAGTPRINELSMIWFIEKENNHCPLQYIITKCNYTASDGNSYLNGTSVQDIPPEIAEASTFITNITVDGLMPFTNYTCWAFTVNTATDSESSELVNATTLEDGKLPSPPTFEIDDIDDSHFSLSWKQPENLAGILKMFEIAINWRIRHPIPNWCVHEKSLSFNTELNATTFDYDYTEAKAFTFYEIKMRAKTGAGWGTYSEPKLIHTKYGVPEAVTKFNSSSIIIKENSNDTNVLDTILTWGLPCSLNGQLEAFIVSVHGTRNGYSPNSFFMMHDCKDYINNNYMCSINLNELKGEYNYTFTISTKIIHVDTPGPATSQSKLYPAGIPSQPDDEYIESIKLDPYKARRTTTTATVLLPLFPNTNGDIKYYAIMVSEKGHNKPLTRRFDLNSKTWPNVSSWEEAMMSDFSITYQATRPKWDPYQNHIADYGRIKAVKYTIGEDTTCKEISSNNDKRLYCNGPLKPDTTYDVRMRAFTYGGYSDSVSFEIKTNAELKVALVIGTVFSILFVGIVVTMMLLVRKCSPYLVLRRFLHSDMPGSPVPAPFTRKKFISHCQQLVDNPGKLSNEFRLLQTLSVDLQMPTNTACLQANRKKNRYSDILPYDFSRVKLEVIDNDPNTDYINASFIRGYTGEDEYIACQGPKEETTYDFWRMVDQYNINIIVMLTQLIEKGKEKCHQYYPAIKETFRYENMTIRCTSELDFRTHTQRTLILQKENKKRNIIHLHFKDWPDHDVPEDFDAMINFCQIMRRNISTNKGFIVVHCSAGIGRTGTLIAIDILLQHLRDNRKLDVFGIVYRLRHHRINMVQRESQYAYIYNCIKQVLKNPYFLKTYKPPPVDPIYENISKKAKDISNTDTNLVNNLEILKKYNSSISMGSLESIYNLFPWSIAKNQRSTINSGLRHYKSMGAINVKTHHITIGKSRTLDRVFFKSLKNSENELNKDSRIQESLPLLTCSIDILGDSAQNATDTCERDDSIM